MRGLIIGGIKAIPKPLAPTGGITRADAGYHFRLWHPSDDGTQATHAHGADRVTRVGDPVGMGIVDSLARPGCNITGFMVFEFSFAGKWLDLLKQIAPHITRVAVFREDTNPTGFAQFAAVQAMATSAGLQVTPVSVRDSDKIASAVEAFAHSPNSGAIITAGALNTGHRDLILNLIARYKLPAIYYDRVSVTAGGLMSYDRVALSRDVRFWGQSGHERLGIAAVQN
jgi:ABC-type uncharacterized transport system substrate-binding protein